MKTKVFSKPTAYAFHKNEGIRIFSIRIYSTRTFTSAHVPAPKEAN